MKKLLHLKEQKRKLKTILYGQTSIKPYASKYDGPNENIYNV